MTAPKIRACPTCGRDDHLSLYKYDNGWQHVECDHCFYLGPGESRAIDAIRAHNKRSDAARTVAIPTPMQLRYQGERCGCKGADDMCPCQNVALRAPDARALPEIEK